MLIVAGVLVFGLGMVMMLVARPRGGKVVPFLTLPFVEISYALLVTVLIGLGAMATLGGLAVLFFSGISN